MSEFSLKGIIVKRAVCGLVANESQAMTIVNHLKEAGFVPDDISALLPDRSGSRDFAHEKHTKAPEAALTGASGGALIGGIVGWLASLGILTVPGSEAFVVAGQSMSVLSGAALGAMAGGLAGAFVGMWFPEYEARRYTGKIRHGNILLSVHTDTVAELGRAWRILRRGQAKGVAITRESRWPAAEETPEEPPLTGQAEADDSANV